MCDWIDQGYITIEMLSGNTKKKGLCVMHKPESTIKEERGFVND
jgi:hypothetical protein